MMRISYIAGCVLIATVICAGCGEGFDSRSGASIVQTPLIDGFVSRQSTAAVETRLLQQGNAKIAVVEEGESNEKRSNFRSPLSVRVLNISGYSYLGIEGELRLEFVDGELAATWFFPIDVARFEVELAKQWPRVKAGQPIRLYVATELRADVDYRGKRYWAWEDVNLRLKVERWIKENA